MSVYNDRHDNTALITERCASHAGRNISTKLACAYGLEACPLLKSDRSSLDFAIDRFFMKLFQTSSINIVRPLTLFVFVNLFLILNYRVYNGENVLQNWTEIVKFTEAIL